MQAINGIQNTNINTVAANLNGMVVDASSAHRTYLLEPSCEMRPVSKRPCLTPCSPFTSDADRKQAVDDGLDGENDRQAMRSLRWRFDHRHLPGAAWAMLVLNRTLCG